jgi:hypothetical protein
MSDLDPVDAERIIAARQELTEAERAARSRVDELVDDTLNPRPPGGDPYDDRPDEKPEPVPAPDPDERSRRLLELNGFSAIRSEALNALNTLVSIPTEALDACLAFNERMVVGLLVQDAREALRIAERHSEYLRFIRRLRKDLEHVEERIQARERITAP